MKHVILHGAGEALYEILAHIEKMDYFLIDEIWDKDEKLKEKSFHILGKTVCVRQPYTDDSGRLIIITSNRYYEEIKNQLVKEFHINEMRIKDGDYIFEPIAEEIKERYADSNDKSIMDILTYLQKHKIQVFNGKWTEEFDMAYHPPEMFEDCQCGMFYTFWNGKKLYFKKEYDKEQAENYILSIMKEQDVHSPHYYKKEGFEVREGDVVLDGGAAEGFFALECVEKASHVYIVEGDRGWIEALQKTFEPFKDKVTIIPKWLGGYETDRYITIESINKENPITLMKLDIEGAEEEVLKTALAVMRNEGFRVIACTYHRSGDACRIEKILKESGLHVQFSDGYMFFKDDQLRIVPELRRGLIFANREKT